MSWRRLARRRFMSSGFCLSWGALRLVLISSRCVPVRSS